MNMNMYMYMNRVQRMYIRPLGRAFRAIGDMFILARTSSFHRQYYEKQRGKHFPLRLSAIYDYINNGVKNGIEPNPLYSTLWMASRGHKFRNLADYLKRATIVGNPSPHPLFDTLLFPTRYPSMQSKYGFIEAFMVSASDTTLLFQSNDDFEQQSVSLGQLTRDAELPNKRTEIIDAGLSVIVDDVSSHSRALEVLGSIAKAGNVEVVEIILIPANGRNDLYQLLSYLQLVDTKISIGRRAASTSRGEALNAAVKSARGRQIMFLHSGHRLAAGSLPGLRSLLEVSSANVVQPMSLDRTGLICSAGVAFPCNDPIPFPWLRGISPATADMPGIFVAPAAQFPYMLRREDLPQDRVFDDEASARWIDVDLALRVADGRQDAVIVATAFPVVRVMKSPYEPNADESTLSAYQQAAWSTLIEPSSLPISSTSLGVAEIELQSAYRGVHILRMKKPERSIGFDGDVPRLRWSIKTSAPSTLDADSSYQWGDTYFANSLRDSLVRLNQIVAVDFLENRSKVSGYLDDVVLNIQGYESIVAEESAVNVTWVISHPELSMREDIEKCQLAYAASHYWAELKSHDWGVVIEPLLQCTDSELFHYKGVDVRATNDIVFVGNTQTRTREIVLDCIRKGIEVAVYGEGWQGLVPSYMIRAEHVENTELCRIYKAAKATLNDHWPAMRDQGFLSNRAFDVVASCGRLISDEVHGVPESILTHMAIEFDMDSLLSADQDLGVSDGDVVAGRIAAAEYVLAHHTFDARAARLVDDVSNLLKG